MYPFGLLPLAVTSSIVARTFKEANTSREHAEGSMSWANWWRSFPAGVFFQRCEIKATHIVIDYKPRRLDVGALRGGNLVEVLNITAWSDVLVNLPQVTLTGVHGWDELGSLLTQRYVSHITSTQVRHQAEQYSIARQISPMGAL